MCVCVCVIVCVCVSGCVGGGGRERVRGKFQEEERRGGERAVGSGWGGMGRRNAGRGSGWER